MDQIGTYVIYVIMFCADLRALAAIRNDQAALGKEFLEGLRSIGLIFVSAAGIMGSAPYLSAFLRESIGPLMHTVGVDPAVAATSVIANDNAGYQRAHVLATSSNGVVASNIGLMVGTMMVVSIPVGFAMLDKFDHEYMALGVMYGVLRIPVGVLLSCLAIFAFEPSLLTEIGIAGAMQPIVPDISTVLVNLATLAGSCIMGATLLRLSPRVVVTASLLFGRVMYSAITIVLVLSVVQYSTGLPGWIVGGWGFDPIIADQFRALEIVDSIGILLAGAFPMVYLITRYLSAPTEAIGARIDLGAAGAASLIAGAANTAVPPRRIDEAHGQDSMHRVRGLRGFLVRRPSRIHREFSARADPVHSPRQAGQRRDGFLLAWALARPAVEASQVA